MTQFGLAVFSGFFSLSRLQSLYNAFPPNFPYRFSIFVATLEYAAETNLFHVMLPYIKYVSFGPLGNGKQKETLQLFMDHVYFSKYTCLR